MAVALANISIITCKNVTKSCQVEWFKSSKRILEIDLFEYNKFIVENVFTAIQSAMSVVAGKFSEL